MAFILFADGTANVSPMAGQRENAAFKLSKAIAAFAPHVKSSSR
jgi:hypothetical protein